jgi:hypothetical protein
MRPIYLGLILLASSCAEPTAISSGSVAPTTVAAQHDNSYSINAANGTVYVTLARVRSEEQGDEPIHAFIQRMVESADSAGARRLVIDLRSVTGSDARLLVPLIRGIVTRDRFVREGALYIVVGPNSFSARQNAAMLLRQYAHPIFVGPPPASGPIT